jgi:hypothetical protein
VMAWLREADGERVLCLLNVGDESRRCALPLARLAAEDGEVVVATSDRAGRVRLSSVVLAPLEGVALRLG